jgi:hypothetical protein
MENIGEREPQPYLPLPRYALYQSVRYGLSPLDEEGFTQ